MSGAAKGKSLKERIESIKFYQDLPDKDFVIAARIVLRDPEHGQLERDFIDREIRLRMLLKGGVSL